MVKVGISTKHDSDLTVNSPRDGEYVITLREQPSQRQLARSTAFAFGEFLELVNDIKVLSEVLIVGANVF
jgi:hypothetical protein